MAKILITDDDLHVRAMMRLTLEMKGHRCAEAGNGDEALAAYAAQAFDLVITDILMPVRDGLETIIDLKRENPHVKIIAISSGGQNGTDAYLRVARHIGATAVILKPFSQSELRNTVEEVLLIPSGPGASP